MCASNGPFGFSEFLLQSVCIALVGLVVSICEQCPLQRKTHKHKCRTARDVNITQNRLPLRQEKFSFHSQLPDGGGRSIRREALLLVAV